MADRLPVCIGLFGCWSGGVSVSDVAAPAGGYNVANGRVGPAGELLRSVGELLALDRLLILGAASAAAIGLVQVALLPTDPALTLLVADRVSLTFLAIGTLGAVPLAFAMPLVRGRFFGRMWRGPRLAFILPLFFRTGSSD